MHLVYKQLFRQIIKDRIFMSLLFLLTMLPSLSFFFAMFSIDENLKILEVLDFLSENQQLYKNALNSNSIIANRFLVSLICLSALMFVMFFYRFFRANRKQIGCIKALGFKDDYLRLFFVAFTAVFSFFGALSGMLGGFFLSEILMSANSETYGVTGLIKGIGWVSILKGITVSTAVFCITAYFCYGFAGNKEAGCLLAGEDQKRLFSATLRAADQISRIAPADKRLSLRIALRKPLSVFLLFAAVMSFNVCIILGQSLNISSAKVYDSQTAGHNYNYDVRFTRYQTSDVPGDTMVYIDSSATFFVGSYELERRATGLYHMSGIYELRNKKGDFLPTPREGSVYINPEFSEIYGAGVGELLKAKIAGTEHSFIVADIAVNANAKSIYMNGNDLSQILGAAAGAYNGVLCLEERSGDSVTTKAHRMEKLRRDAVSNKISGVINQSMGVFAGAILILLALYINFQDNTHDILILNMMGQPVGYIRKMLIDVYLPILWTAFMVTLVPGILLAKKIQWSLSISTNDYMPFGISLPVVFIDFSIISLIYWGVQKTFSLGIKRVIRNSEIVEILYAE